MSKIQSFLVFDNSSLANYKNWCWGASSSVYGIHQALEQLGFSQTSDQGQVVWNTITATITSVASTGTIATYGYSTLSPADPVTTNRTLRAGMLINAITGLTNSGFDVTAPGNVLILSVTPTSTTTGTFTTATAQGALGTTSDSGSLSIPGLTFPTAWSTETLNVAGAQNNIPYNGSTNVGYTSTYFGYWNSGTTYPIGSVVTWASTSTNPNNYLAIVSNTNVTPTTSVNQTDWRFYNYEMWQTNDGVSPTYYIKIEYTNNGTNTPGLILTIGTATTGQLVTGSNFGGSSLQFLPPNTLTNRELLFPGTAAAAQGATTFECDFYGGGSGTSFSFLLWRNGGNNIPMYFGIERSLNTSGSAIGSYMTCARGTGGTTTAATWTQQCVFPIGSNPGIGTRTNFVPTISMPDTTSYFPGNVNSYQLGQNIAALPCFPLVGYVGNPMTILLGLRSNDAVEGGTFTVTLYGTTHTYLMTKANPANYFGNPGAAVNTAFAIRWE